MTHDERIEAMARIIEAACDSGKPWNIFDTMQLAWAAADVEGMVREAIAQTVALGFSPKLVYDDSVIDAIVARVMQGAG
jgi:hypothetical protein